AAAVGRVVARTHAGGSRRTVGAVGIVDDLAGNRIPFRVVDAGHAGTIGIGLFGSRRLECRHRPDELLSGPHHATGTGFSALGQIGEQAVAGLLGILLQQAFGLVIASVRGAKAARVQSAIAHLYADTDRVRLVAAICRMPITGGIGGIGPLAIVVVAAALVKIWIAGRADLDRRGFTTKFADATGRVVDNRRRIRIR